MLAANVPPRRPAARHVPALTVSRLGRQLGHPGRPCTQTAAVAPGGPADPCGTRTNRRRMRGPPSRHAPRKAASWSARPVDRSLQCLCSGDDCSGTVALPNTSAVGFAAAPVERARYWPSFGPAGSGDSAASISACGLAGQPDPAWKGQSSRPKRQPKARRAWWQRGVWSCLPFPLETADLRRLLGRSRRDGPSPIAPWHRPPGLSRGGSTARPWPAFWCPRAFCGSPRLRRSGRATIRGVAQVMRAQVFDAGGRADPGPRVTQSRFAHRPDDPGACPCGREHPRAGRGPPSTLQDLARGSHQWIACALLCFGLPTASISRRPGQHRPSAFRARSRGAGR